MWSLKIRILRRGLGPRECLNLRRTRGYVFFDRLLIFGFDLVDDVFFLCI